jgi:ABC-type transport system substrate-binding protein
MVAMLVGGVVAAACRPTAAPSAGVGGGTATPRSGGTVNVGVSSAQQIETDRINTTGASWATSLHIYDALYTQDNNTGAVGPALAEKTDISADGLTWTLTLRSGVKFHDGSDFDAAAVKTNLDIRKTHPTFGLKAQLGPVTEVAVIDPRTVQLHLSTPAASLQVILSSPAFAMQSPAQMAKYPQAADYRANASGTGPFKLTALTPESQATVVRNDAYWGPKPYLDSIVWKVIADPQAVVSALEAGDAQAISVPSAEVQRLSDAGKVNVVSRPSPSPTFIVLNTAKKVFADKRVRQAIAYGLDRQATLGTNFNLGQVADSVIAPSIQGYAKGTPYTLDVSQGKQLLAQAGVAVGTPLQLLSRTDNTFLALTQLLKQQLDALGFASTITTVDQSGWLQAVNTAAASSTWDVTTATIGMAYNDAEAALLRAWLSTNVPPAGANWSNYVNPQVDMLLNQQAITLDQAARNQILAQIQQIVLEDVNMYPLYLAEMAYGSSKSLYDLDYAYGQAIVLNRAWLAQ